MAAAPPPFQTASPADSKVGPWLAVALGSIGLALLAIAAVTALNRLRAGANWVQATGTVVGYEEVTSSSRSQDEPGGAVRASRVYRTSSYPIVEFVDQEGKTHRFTSRLGAVDGTQMQLPVVYPSGDLVQAEVQHWFAQTGWMVITAGVGMLLCIVAWLTRRFF